VSKYFRPDNQLEVRKLNYVLQYSEFISQLRPGEVLVGKYFNLIFYAYPKLDSEAEFACFEKMYSKGNYVSREFFAVPEDSKNFL